MNTFKELKEMIVEYVRNDEILTKLPMFIKLTEANIQRKLVHMTSLFQTATLTLDSGEQYANVIGVHTIKEASINGQRLVQMPFVDTDTSYLAEPTEFSIEGKSKLKFYPTPNRAYQVDIIYMPILSPLLTGGSVDEDATNWILQEAPDVYLYGVLATVAAYLNTDDLQKWSTMFNESVKEFKAVNQVAGQMTSIY